MLHSHLDDLIHSHGFTYYLYVDVIQVSIFSPKALFQISNHLLDNSTCISHKYLNLTWINETLGIRSIYDKF